MKKVLSILFVVLILCFAFVGCNKVDIERYKNADKYSTGNFTYSSDDIKKIEINWVAGEINIKQSENATLSVKESAENSLPESKKMHYLIDGTTLIIQYAKSGFKGDIDEKHKKLDIEIPKNISLEIDTVSSDIISDGLNLRYFDADTVSGNIKINSFVCTQADIDTVSGNVEFDLFECYDMDFDSVSANLTLSLPNDGLKIDMETVSGKLNTEKSYSKDRDEYIFGKGKMGINADTVSGDITVK